MTPAQKRLLSELEIGTESETVTNPYSGRSCLLEPQAVALYDLIKGCEITGNLKDFDRARYLFCELYPDEYMILID